MSLNTEHLDLVTIEELASLFFSPGDICINLELNEDDTELFLIGISQKQTFIPAVAAYFKGWFTAEITLRKAIKQSALNGSSPSQQIFLNYQRESRS